MDRMETYWMDVSGFGKKPFSINAMIPNNAPQEWNRSDESLSSSPVPVMAE